MGINLEDKRLNLRIKEIIKTDGIITHFKCLCDCGSYATIARNKFGITKSCGCALSKTGEKSSVWTGYKDISGSFWWNYINGAKSRNLDFQLEIEDAWNIFEKQNRKCAFSNISINFRESRYGELGTASLDRIDNNLGYNKNNIQWVHKIINKMRMNLSVEEFKMWCKLVVQNEN